MVASTPQLKSFVLPASLHCLQKVTVTMAKHGRIYEELKDVARGCFSTLGGGGGGGGGLGQVQGQGGHPEPLHHVVANATTSNCANSLVNQVPAVYSHCRYVPIARHNLVAGWQVVADQHQDAHHLVLCHTGHIAACTCSPQPDTKPDTLQQSCTTAKSK